MANSNSDHKTPKPLGNEEAANLIRGQIDELHGQYKTDEPTSKDKKQLIDKFWRENKHRRDHQSAWAEFYSGLSNVEKQQLWEEYHDVQFSSDQPELQTQQTTDHKTDKNSHKKENVAETKARLLKKVKKPAKKKSDKPTGWRAQVKPLIIAAVVMVTVLALNYNELVVAQVKQYISPGDSLRTPIIIDPNEDVNVGNQNKIIIPKINVDVPVVYDIKTYDEAAIQAGLERGVVHYGDTALPGKPGNNVIVGHSSNNFFNSGKYKFAFVLLDRLELDDTFILHFRGTRYIYKVTNKKVIEPNDFSLIQPTAVPTTTLITCTPPGTSWKRLVIQGEQISPEPTKNKPLVNPVEPTEGSEIVPGNAPSLFQRVRDWLFNR